MISNGSLLGTLRGHKKGIWCVRFSPVDQCLATSSADSTIKIWALSDFTCVKTLEGHTSSVLKICFLTRGMQLVSRWILFFCLYVCLCFFISVLLYLNLPPKIFLTVYFLCFSVNLLNRLEVHLSRRGALFALLPLCLNTGALIHFSIRGCRLCKRWLSLNLYTLESECIFSILLFINFLRCCQGEFVFQPKVSFVGDHFLYSHDLNVWFRGGIVGRN